MWPMIQRNYKPTSRKTRGRPKRNWKGNFEAGTGNKLPNPRRQGETERGESGLGDTVKFRLLYIDNPCPYIFTILLFYTFLFPSDRFSTFSVESDATFHSSSNERRSRWNFLYVFILQHLCPFPHSTGHI